MIRVFSDAFELITEIDAVDSVMWTKRWHKQGEFQIVVNQHMEHVDELLEGRIVSVGSNKTGIIAHIEEMTSENGKGDNQLIVRGYDLKGILAKRFTIPPEGQAYDGQTADVETLMKQFVNNNAVLTTSERIISNLTVAPNLNRGSSFYYQTRFKNLRDELEKLSVTSGLGWDVLFDGVSYTFDVLEGRDLTSIQTINPPVIFSAEFDNVKSQKVIESSLDYKNVAIVAGQGEGAAREIAFIGTASGLERNEIFIDARDIEEGGNLQDRGQQKLDEYAKVESFETSVLTYGPFQYGTDWRLGDIVTVQNAKKNRTSHLRVTEVVEVIEVGGLQLDVIFGQPMPTIIEKIKRELDEPVSEGGTVGEPGTPGTDGVGMDYVWNGTSLGIKRDDESTYVYSNLKGIKGDKGEVGLTGPQGIQGLKGDTGNIGPQGLTGPTGPQGTQGVKGNTGNTGPIGLTGPQGVKGDTGPIGPQGIKGDLGNTGPQGPAGDGNSYVVFQEEFISTQGQRIFTWNDGYEYPLGVNAVSIFVSGNKQPNHSFVETNGHTVTLDVGLDAGEFVLVEAMQSVIDLQGPKGEQGPIGLTGSQGPAGATGPIGPQGIQGIKGATGIQGPIGLAGVKGDKGDIGLTGPTGPKGDTGDQGIMGPPGSSQSYVLFEKEFINTEGQRSFSWTDAQAFPIGIKAVNLFINGERQPQTSFTEHSTGKGITLVQGLPVGEYVIVSAQMAVVDIQGPQGPQGPQGIQGPIGNTGATGAQGIQGIKGDTGEQGPIGNSGPIGPTGLTGSQGNTGATGAQGIQGIAGLDGKTWHSTTAAPATGLGAIGDMHVNTVTWAISEKMAATIWTLRGNIKGATGNTGATGSQGVQGPIGNTGAQGIQGIKGDTGNTGATGSIGPLGPQGPKGDTGATGPAGASVADSVEWANVLSKPAVLPPSEGVINEGSGCFISNPKGAMLATQDSLHTGPIKITLPQLWTNTMMRFTIDIFDYATREAFSITVGGYNYSSSATWINPQAYIISSNANRDFNIRLGHDGVKACVWIGELNTPWSYPQIVVKDFFAGYSNYQKEKWDGGWAITLETTFDTVSVNMVANLVVSANHTHTHDDRYYTETEINANWLQKHQLTSGATAIGAATDWNNYKTTGFYMGVAMANEPTKSGAHTWKYVQVIQHNSIYSVQVAWDFNGIGMWYRAFLNGVWQPWFEVETTAGSQAKLNSYKPYQAGTTAPSNTNIFWIDTN